MRGRERVELSVVITKKIQGMLIIFRCDLNNLLLNLCQSFKLIYNQLFMRGKKRGLVFQLRPLKDQCKMSLNQIESDYIPSRLCPRKCELNGSYLNDKKFYTEAFVEKKDKVNLKDYTAKWKSIFKEWIKNEQDLTGDKKDEKILKAAPNSDRKRCSICKTRYSDYFQHIQLQEHKAKINSNPFNTHILQMQKKYKKIRQAQILQRSKLRLKQLQAKRRIKKGGKRKNGDQRKKKV